MLKKTWNANRAEFHCNVESIEVMSERSERNSNNPKSEAKCKLNRNRQPSKTIPEIRGVTCNIIRPRIQPWHVVHVNMATPHKSDVCIPFNRHLSRWPTVRPLWPKNGRRSNFETPTRRTWTDLAVFRGE